MIEVKEMIIRVPGLGEEEARWLGEAVVQRMYSALPQMAANRYIHALDVQLSLSDGLSAGEMADMISEQLLLQLKNT